MNAVLILNNTKIIVLKHICITGEKVLTTAERIAKQIKRSRRYVLERKDLGNYGSYDLFGRALKRLVEKGGLMKTGYGLFIKSTINCLTKKAMPTNPGGTDAILLGILR